MDIYKRLGIRKVINASGTKTHLGGSISDLQVLEAMKEASQHFIIMMELIEKAGEIIAKATGAEAGLITSGSSAAMTLAAAACMMKDTDLDKYQVRPFERLEFDEDWIEIIQSLPKNSFNKNLIIIPKMHRNPFDVAYTIARMKIIEIGTEKGSTLQDFKAAINDKTVAISLTALVDNTPEKIGKNPSLSEVVKLAHNYNIPVIVDAAAELPSRQNLKKYIKEGADLVIYSGGKHISGPNDTGILCGRKDLIKLATLQSAPYRGIGRGMKVDRTQIIGFIKALELWLNKDEKKEYKKWMAKAIWMADELKKVPKIIKTDIHIEKLRSRPYAHITFNESLATDLVLELRKGNPSIWLERIGVNKIEIDPSNLKDGEEKIVVNSIKKYLNTSLNVGAVC